MTADEAFTRIVKELRADPRVTETKMFGSLGLKVGGKVLGMLYKGALVVKLPQERVKKLVQSGEGRYFDPGHGRLMKEWVSVGTSAGPQWMALAREARDFVASGAGRLPTKRPQTGRARKRR